MPFYEKHGFSVMEMVLKSRFVISVMKNKKGKNNKSKNNKSKKA